LKIFLDFPPARVHNVLMNSILSDRTSTCCRCHGLILVGDEIVFTRVSVRAFRDGAGRIHERQVTKVAHAHCPWKSQDAARARSYQLEGLESVYVDLPNTPGLEDILLAIHTT